MDLGRIASLAVLILGLGGVAMAAEEPTLADAAERGDGALIRTLLDAGEDVTVAQVDGMTALHWAVYHDDAETAELLVRAGAEVNAENRYGVPPLSLAATNRNAPLVTLLLDAGADANAVLQGGETVLMTAARTGSLKAVEALLGNGADPNALELRGQTALMWAAAEGHSDVVGTLVEAGADINARLKSGFTPIFFAVRGGHIDVVHTLLAAGVDVDEVLQRIKDGPDETVNNASYRPVDDGMSPLLMAVRNGHFELAVTLVKAGADPNDQRTGFNPLHTTAWVRKPDASDRGEPRSDWVRKPDESRVCSGARDAGGGRERAVAGTDAAPATHGVSTRDGRGHGVSDGCRPSGHRPHASADRAGCGPDAAKFR